VGNDTYYVASGDLDVVTEAAGEGTDLIRVTGSLYSNWYMPPNVENAIQSGEETHFGLHGNVLDNIITGTTGSDDLYGNDGGDTLNGGANYDFLYGENGDDRINGGAGDDFLYGG